MKAPSNRLAFGVLIIAFIFSTIALSFSIFGLPGSSLGKAVEKAAPAPEPQPEESAQPMPATMDNPSVEDIHKLAMSAGRVVYFSYHIMPGSNFPFSLTVEYPGVGFNRIDLDGLNNSHLYFQLNEALRSAGKLR